MVAYDGEMVVVTARGGADLLGVAGPTDIEIGGPNILKREPVATPPPFL
jgi:hypothetical protein